MSALVPQLPMQAELGELPTGAEVMRAMLDLRLTGPGRSGLHAAMWRALTATAEAMGLVVELVQQLWEEEQMPREWCCGLLKILPKKGDLTQPGNYRGIVLLEVAYKVVARILASRLARLHAELGDDEQQHGFVKKRGCVDASFVLLQALRKRREHGLESWVLFLDLVKAFESVPHWVLVEAARLKGYPIALLKLSIAAYRLARSIGVDGVYSRLIVANRGITAGSGFATSELRVLMLDLIFALQARWANIIIVKVYVDDLTLSVTGLPQVIIRELSRAIDFAVHVLEDAMLMKVSAKKSKIVASKPSIAPNRLHSPYHLSTE